MNKNDIVQMGENAVGYLAKYPYSSVKDKNFHKQAAVIGKLASEGYIDIVKPVSDDDLKRIGNAIEREIEVRRKNGDY